MCSTVSGRSVLTSRRNIHLRLVGAAGSPDVDHNTLVGRPGSRSLYREYGRSHRRSDPHAGDPT
jgi:hypothetical protein